MLARFGAEKDAVVAAYDPEKTGNLTEVGVGVMSDGAMVEPARLLARLASAAGPPTFAAAANAYWVAFAKAGDPNGDGRPKWPAYSAKDDVIMDFAITGLLAKPDPWKARLDLIERADSKPTP